MPQYLFVLMSAGAEHCGTANIHNGSGACNRSPAGLNKLKLWSRPTCDTVGVVIRYNGWPGAAGMVQQPVLGAAATTGRQLDLSKAALYTAAAPGLAHAGEVEAGARGESARTGGECAGWGSEVGSDVAFVNTLGSGTASAS